MPKSAAFASQNKLDVPAVDDLTLAPLSLSDVPALMAFEVENRIWFETQVGPRPDTYWQLNSLTEVIKAQVAAGEMMFLIKRDGAILGRLNLTAVEHGVAQLGYRIAQAQTGQGIATRAVTLAIDLARTRGLWALEARVLDSNAASKRVLEKTGFTRTGQSTIGEMACTLFRRDL